MTLDFLAPWYPWTKSLHVIAVFAWMAGLFYLPRLFIYHMQVPVGDSRSELFKVMERRLLRAIMNPAMIAAWIFAILLVLTPGVVSWTSGWWYVKLVSVVAMTWFHMYLARHRKAFERDERPFPQRHWRIMNEVPTVLMIVIVIMVIVKPF